MAATDQVETVLVHRKAGHTVKVGHHGVHHGPGVVVIEPDDNDCNDCDNKNDDDST